MTEKVEYAILIFGAGNGGHEDFPSLKTDMVCVDCGGFVSVVSGEPSPTQKGLVHREGFGCKHPNPVQASSAQFLATIKERQETAIGRRKSAR